MSTQDPYGSSDPAREQRTGSSPVGGSGSDSSQYGSSYGQPQGQPQDAPRDGQYGQQPQQYGQQPQQYGQQPQQYGQQPQQYGQGHPAQGGYDGRPAPKNGLGVAALVLGILAFLSGLFIIGGLFGLVAVVLGFLALRKVKRGEASSRGLPITGIVLGIIGIIAAVLAVAGIGLLGSRAANCDQFANDQVALEQCLADQFGVDAQQLDG